jgi:serine/threonine protein kinase
MTGYVLSGRYRVGSRIGSGGMGMVFQGEQLALKRQVAIKVLAPHMRQNEEALRRFFVEAKTVASLGHDNIVDIFDYGVTEDGLAFMVMEHLVGQPLNQLLQERGRLPWPFVRHVVQEVLAGLAAAHDKGIVHRDVKPSNCFCVQAEAGALFPRIKLLDFGISKLLSGSAPDFDTQQGLLVGSPSYVSPEQARTRDVDARSDLYSVGIMVYELLTGYRPFHSKNIADVLHKHVHERPPAFKEVSPDLVVPPGVEELVFRALEKSPMLRFQSAREMASALSALPGGTNEQGEGIRNKVASHRTASSNIRPGTSGAAQRDRTELQKLLGKVQRFWLDGILSESARHTPPVPQRRTREDGLVDRPWDVSIDDRVSIDTTKSPYEVFESCERELLIIGSPGTGKTTVLLQLAQSLSEGVGSLDSGEAIPVVFSLATFNGRFQQLGAWLVEELRSRYRVPARIARHFLKTRRILPLLDGLDECPAEVRSRCVEAINRFQKDHSPQGLVVTCRLEEYLALPFRLQLGGALRLHELTSAQLDSYLDHLRMEGQPLRTFLRKNDGLSDMARSPLILSIINTLFQNSGTDGELEAPVEPTLGGLYERYLATMLRRKRKQGAIPPPELAAGLKRFAENMAAHHQPLFLFHDLQATWLRGSGGRVMYTLLSRLLVGLLFGLSLVFPMGLSPLNTTGFQPSLAFGFQFGLALALVTSAVYGLDALHLLRSYQNGGNPLRTAARRHVRRAVLGCTTGILMGALMYFNCNGAVAPIASGVQMGLFSVLIFCHWYGPEERYHDITTVEAFQWSWASFLRAIPLALVIGALVALPVFWFETLRAALCVGALGCGIYLLFKAVQRATIPIKDTPDVAITLSLRSAALCGASFAVLVTLIFGVAYGPMYAVLVGLNLGLWAALWYGGFAVVLHYTLRRLLQFDGQPEYQSVEFFDAAVDRLLLRASGGGYMFIHPTFQQHMAERRTAGSPLQD